MLELWGMRSTSSLPSLPGSIQPGVVAPNRVLSMGQIELNCVLRLKWITWNRTVLTFKLYTYAKLNCLKWNCFCMLNWIVWKRTVLRLNRLTNQLFMYKWYIQKKMFNLLAYQPFGVIFKKFFFFLYIWFVCE